nr:hypothetical protein OHB51_17325 [Micromonospora sp. NBC_00855]
MAGSSCRARAATSRRIRAETVVVATVNASTAPVAARPGSKAARYAYAVRERYK